MAEAARTATTHEAEASPATRSNPASSGVGSTPTSTNSNEAHTSQDSSHPLLSIDVSGTNEGTGETGAKSQDSNEGVEATSMGTEAGEQQIVGGAAEEEEASSKGDSTGAKEGVETVQTTKVAPANELKPEETPTHDNPSKLDADGAGSATATTNRMGPATEPVPPGNVSKDGSSDRPVSKDAESVVDQDDPNEALHDAAWSGSVEDIKKWLGKGAEILATNDAGETALHLAVRNTKIDAVSALLKQYEDRGLGSGINYQDRDGWTPLYGAVSSAYMSGPTTVVSKILGFPGVNPTIKGNSGKTPLYLACYYGNLDVAKLILEAKDGLKTIETTDKQGWTPLQEACWEGELKILELLLLHKAKTDIRDLAGRTPLHSASAGGRVDLIKTLLSKQPTLIDQVDSNSQTALHLAVQQLADDRDALDVLRDLITDHARVDIVDSDGLTALHLAGRGEGERYKKAIGILSCALDPGKRKESLLDFSANEEPAALARLLENLDWTDFTESEVKAIKEEAKLIWIVAPTQMNMHNNGLKQSRDNVREQLQNTLKTSPPYSFPPNTKEKDLSALQLASYFRYHRLVYMLLLNNRWEEIKEDRDDALRIAKNVIEKRKTNQQKGTEIERRRSGIATDGMEERKTKQQKSAEIERRNSDYELVVDFLNDPPAGDYELVRGWSQIDDLNQEPQLDETSRGLAEQFYATIVDFHKVQDTTGSTRVDFLRRTRRVWDVIYAEQTKPDTLEKGPKAKLTSREKNPKSKAVDKDGKGNDLEKKQPKVVSSNKPSGEMPGGPKQIMEDARKKTRQTGSSATGKNDKELIAKRLRLPNGVVTVARNHKPKTTASLLSYFKA